MRISPRWIVASAALVFGGLAAVGTHRTIAERIALLEKSNQTIYVKQVVANQDLAAGSRLNASTVSVRQIPKEWAYADALTPEQIDRFDNASLDAPAKRGQPILWQQLAPQARSLSDRIEPGRRALTVPVDEVSSLAGMVVPGDRIDLLLAVRRASGAALIPVVQNALVLATGSRSDARAPGSGEVRGLDARGFSTLTLDVSPDTARKIFAAREVGQLTAALRSRADEESTPMQKTDALRLLGLAAPPPSSAGVQVIYADRLSGTAAMRRLP